MGRPVFRAAFSFNAPRPALLQPQSAPAEQCSARCIDPFFRYLCLD